MKLLRILIASVLTVSPCWAQDLSKVPPANYDESKIKPYTLPDPLVFNDGRKVGSAKEWPARRSELLETVTREMFGRIPNESVEISADTPQIKTDALGGLAKRKLVTLHLKRNGKDIPVDLLIYTPSQATGKVPLFMGLNFNGNQAVTNEPDLPLAKSWMRPNKNNSVINNRATETLRGSEASRWQVEKILKNGYGLATIYYGDIDPDFDDGFHNGVHSLFRDPSQQGRTADEWGSIAAWAWGLSRSLDYLQNDTDIDTSKVAVIGHSRLGKASLWAGIADPRFALVITNNSGCGGAAIERREIGETVFRINTAFPHWFSLNFRKYNQNEAKMAFDAHSLITLVAPRPVYIASAEKDTWADPKGEFLSTVGADPVYRLLTNDGIPVKEMPAISSPVMGRLGYHIRPGEHDVVAYDWDQFIAFADKHLKAK
ncbi:MAG: acetylxylan esterase [Planctomycetota bacterium]|nr:MAG: acetylxylan esterase [Planctomycetota bacterium]